MSKKINIMLVVVLLISALLMACQAAPPTPVTVQLNWMHEAEFAGYYVAEAKGYYKEENLTVTLVASDGSVDVPQVLLDRKADFAIMGNGEYKTVHAKDPGATAVAALFQQSPGVLFSLAESGIKKPQDIEGRKLGVKWTEPFVLPLLAEAGVDISKIITVPVKADEMYKLYTGEVDVWEGFATSEPIEAELAGHAVNIIYLGDYGYSFNVYEGLIVTRQDMLDKHSDVVARFVRATLRGWKYAIENPKEAADIVLKWAPDKDPRFHYLGIQAIVPLVDTGKNPIGWIDAQRWQTALGKDYDPARPGYTMKFVEQAQK